jgi:hypothetical protein
MDMATFQCNALMSGDSEVNTSCKATSHVGEISPYGGMVVMLITKMDILHIKRGIYD